MARFYAMIANGGEMVTPHIAQDVEQSSGDPKPTAGAARARDPAGRRRAGVDPTYLQAVQEGLYAGTHSMLRHLLRRLRAVPGPDRRQDRHGREGGHAPRLSEPGEAEPVVVVRLRPVRQPLDRRLRRDRERRPRRHRGGAGRAAGLRGLLQASTARHDDPHLDRLDGDRSRRPARTRSPLPGPRRGRTGRSASSRGSTGCCSARRSRPSATGSGRSAGSRGTTRAAARRAGRRSTPPRAASSSWPRR